MSENGMTVGRIEQLTMSPDMKQRWEDNVQLRIANGKTINTSCVLAAQAKIDMLDTFLEEANEQNERLRSTLASREEEIARLKDELREAKGTEVYSHPDCVFNYCPHPEECKANGGCVSRRVNKEAEESFLGDLRLVKQQEAEIARLTEELAWEMNARMDAERGKSALLRDFDALSDMYRALLESIAGVRLDLANSAAEVERLSKPARPISCVHCGAFVVGVGDRDELRRRMIAHDSECKSNPLVQEVERLTEKLRVVMDKNEVLELLNACEVRESEKEINRLTVELSALRSEMKGTVRVDVLDARIEKQVKHCMEWTGLEEYEVRELVARDLCDLIQYLAARSRRSQRGGGR